MFKHIIISLSLLTIANNIFGSEAPKSPVEPPIRVVVDFGKGIRRICDFEENRTIPFLKFDASGKLIYGEGTVALGSDRIHSITEDPSTWVTTKDLIKIILESDVSAIRVDLETKKSDI